MALLILVTWNSTNTIAGPFPGIAADNSSCDGYHTGLYGVKEAVPGVKNLTLCGVS
jgi:hypothetical protein